MKRILVVLLAVAAVIALAIVAPAAVAAPGARFVQVVAHPDDDMVFMNPDLTTSIASGGDVTSIYLTFGESDVEPSGPYAAGRRAGTRAAFARMARARDVWDSREITLSSGRSVRAQVLRDVPRIRLVLLGLPDDNNPHGLGGKHEIGRAHV